MKLIISIICAIFACINTTNAQVVISTSDLDGTKWQLAKQYDDYSNVYYEYSQGKKIWHQSDGDTFTYSYYLSDTIPTTFDFSKVGVSTKGCYYVQYNPALDYFSCKTILYFSKYEGKMILGLARDSSTTSTFILIPSNKPRNQSANESIIDNW